MNDNVNSLLTGLASSLDKYMGVSVSTQIKQNEAKQQNALETKKASDLAIQKNALDLNKDQTMALYKQHLEGQVDAETASKIHPQAAALVDNFAKTNKRLPTVAEADRLFDDLSKMDNKQAKSDDVRLTQYARLLSSDREFTLQRTKRDNLENVKGLLDQVSQQGEGPDRRQLYEQAIAQVRVLAGSGQISEKEIEHLLPSTFHGKLAQGLEWLTNNPQSTEAQAFLDRGQHFFERESKITNDQMSRRVNELSAPYKQILERNQDVASETFKSYNVNHSKYNPAAKETEAPKNVTTPGETKDVGGQMIHTYPSGKKAIYKDGKWSPYNG